MEQFPSNSNASKEAATAEKDNERQKKVVIVKGHTKTRKNNTRSITSALFPDRENIGEYLVVDLLIPAAKKIVSEFVDVMLFGESGHSRNRDRQRSPYRSYDQYSNNNQRRNYGEASRPAGYNYDDIVIESRGEAEDVLDRLRDDLSEYGIVSVADMYDYCGVASKYTDCKYGWTDLRSAEVVRVHDGYILKMPRALAI